MGVVQGSGPPGDRRSCKGVFLKFLNTTEATLNALLLFHYFCFSSRDCANDSSTTVFTIWMFVGFCYYFSFVYLRPVCQQLLLACSFKMRKWKLLTLRKTLLHWSSLCFCLFCFCFWGEYKSYFSLLFITSNNCTDHEHFWDMRTTAWLLLTFEKTFIWFVHRLFCFFLLISDFRISSKQSMLLR